MADLVSKAFYHGLTRKYVLAFGELFNHIEVVRFDSAGKEANRVVVPISYGPREKFVVRNTQDPDFKRTSAIKLPRLAFKITDYRYDAARKLSHLKYLRQPTAQTNVESFTSMQHMFTPVPYNLSFSLYIIAKSVDEASQIVEQILPMFTPDFSITVNTIPEMSVKDTITIQLENVSEQDSYDGEFNDRREVEWTLTFNMACWFYGPTRQKPIITTAQTSANNESSSLTGFIDTSDSDTPGTPDVDIQLGNPPTGAASGDLTGHYPDPWVRGINGTVLATLPTGILKVTTGSGAVSIATPADFPSVDLSGPVSSSNSITTIGNNVVSNANLNKAPALTIKGNNTASVANVLDLTVSQVNSMLGVAQLSTHNTFIKAQTVTPVVFSNASGTVTVDATASNNFRFNVTGDLSITKPTNLSSDFDGTIFNWYFKQDNAGSHNITFDSSYRFSFGTPPSATPTPNVVDFMSCYYDATDDRLICNYTQSYTTS